MVLRFLLAIVLFFSWTAAGLLGAESTSKATKLDQPAAGTKKYELKYKFQPEETIRWEVEHRAKVRSTIQGTTQTADTLSLSVKVWKIASVDEQGNATLVYSIESVDMRQKFDGRQEVRYNSQTDKKAPAGFDTVAKAVGVPLATFTLDSRGTVIKREEKFVQAAPMQENITLPLPEKAVAVGERWYMPADITVTLKEGGTRKIKARQRFRLEEVSDGVAVINIETQVLTPLNDPAIEAQIVQSKANGAVRFDIDLGRVVGQQSEVDEQVQGFQGPGSSVHYVTRLTEKLLPTAAKTAAAPRSNVLRQ